MEFRILGPVEVESGDRLLNLGPTKQRALLALLLLRANRVVSRDQLVDALWGEHPPHTAAAALHGYVSDLRKILGRERIETRAPGYALHAQPGEVDLERFERLVAEARDLETPDAAERLRAALALWRGPPLQDIEGAPFVDGERRRLEELRISATEDRIEHELAQGRHGEVIAELDELVRQQPLRERLRGQLMLALYGSGRQAEALEVYRDGRKLLAEELGLEPAERLRLLERAILEQDAALGAAARPAAPAMLARPRGASRRRIPPSRRRIPVVALLIAVVTAGIAVRLTAGSGAAVSPDSVAVIDSRSGRLVGDVPVGGRPVAVAVGGRGVWVADPANHAVYRINPKTRKVAKGIEVGVKAEDLASGFGSIWVAGGTDGTVQRIDANTDQLEDTLPLSQSGSRCGPPEARVRPVFWIATGAGAVWATSGNLLCRIDPTTDPPRVVAWTVLPTWPTGLAAGKGAAWVVTQDERLLKFLPATRSIMGPVGSFELRAGGLAPTVGAGSVWLVAYRGRGVVRAVDPSSLAGRSQVHGSAYPLDVTVGDGSVWAVDVHGTVLGIDPRSAKIVTQTTTAPTLRSSIAVGDGAVWVAIQQPD